MLSVTKCKVVFYKYLIEIIIRKIINMLMPVH
jgi:hypothetical protein